MKNYLSPPIPKAFIWKRAHSFTGFWLVLFLMEHLFVNSQAALYFEDDPIGFVRAVNGIKELPFLPIIEIVFLGIPFLIHGIWGIKYLFNAKYNSFPTDGSSPAILHQPRNRAYTWQRITSWILLVGILAHVVHMRFLHYPESIEKNGTISYVSSIKPDAGIERLSKQFNFYVYKENDQLIAVSPSFGVAELLLVRETFKSLTTVFLYTGLVLATCFHAFNGLWTFMISWGVTLTARSQYLMRLLAVSLMVLTTFLGLSAIWGTYLYG